MMDVIILGVYLWLLGSKALPSIPGLPSLPTAPPKLIQSSWQVRPRGTSALNHDIVVSMRWENMHSGTQHLYTTKHSYRDNIHDRSLIAHSTSEVGTSGINNYDARVCPNPYPALANVHTLSLI